MSLQKQVKQFTCLIINIMKLVFILGNAAVGKMTVGQELMKITDLRLFHNHS